MYHGIINIYKEKGFTSHDVVAVLRGILKQKKIGHTGTLDPEATGVLPVCLGKGTKVAGLLTDKNKAYRTTFLLGQETDTQDHTGTVINEAPWSHVTEDLIQQAIAKFTGPIDQVPPMYSALKVNGKKLVDLAREGITVERKSRSIVIHAIEDVVIDLPRISMTVKCSKGTYIRTLVRDIAEALETCGHMIALERLVSGPFDLSDALTLDEVKDLVAEGTVNEVIASIDSMFSELEQVVIGLDFYNLLDNGNKLPEESFVKSVDLVDQKQFNVYNEERDYMGIYEWNHKDQLLVPIKFFSIRQERD